MKSHPHPERPDRLRAIAASLATTGFLELLVSKDTLTFISKQKSNALHSSSFHVIASCICQIFESSD